MNSALTTAQLITKRKLPSSSVLQEVMGDHGAYRLVDAFEGVVMYTYGLTVPRVNILCYMESSTWKVAQHKLFPGFECGPGQRSGVVYDSARDLQVDWNADHTGLYMVQFDCGNAAQLTKICLGVVKVLETGVLLRKFRKIMAGAVGKGDWKTLKAKLVARRKRRAMKGLYFF